MKLKSFVTFLLLLALPLAAQASGSAKKQAAKYRKILEMIDQYYVKDVNIDSLSEGAISYLLYSLDPHSHYVSPLQKKMTAGQSKGEYVGIGVTCSMINDSLRVVSVDTLGTAYKAGIRAGNRILSIDGTKVCNVGMTIEQAAALVLGIDGSTVDVQVKDGEVVRNLTIKRKPLPVPSVSAHFMLDSVTAYLKLDFFSPNSAKEVGMALFNLKEHGMQKLILDLRNNRGGSMDAAAEILSHFIPQQNALLASIKGENYPEFVFYKKDGEWLFEQGDMCVLTNEYSCSASEFVSGTLQDYDRAAIVGRRTFGKGMAQRTFQYDADRSDIVLICAYFYTPSGRCLQRPYNGGENAEYETEVRERFVNPVHRELCNALDSSQYRTLSGRVIYGDWGVVPDVVVETDTALYNNYVYDIVDRKLLAMAVRQYITANYDQLSAFPAIDSLCTAIEMPQIQKNLESTANSLGAELPETLWQDYGDFLSLQVRKLVAFSFYGQETCVKYFADQDETLKAAYKLLQDNAKLKAILKP